MGIIYGVTMFLNALTGQPEYGIAQPVDMNIQECKAIAAQRTRVADIKGLINPNGEAIKITFDCFEAKQLPEAATN